MNSSTLPSLPQKHLSLFQTFYGSLDHNRLSNIIEIWDAAPKYITPSRPSSNSISTGFLERDFEYRGKVFHMLVAPAVIKGKGGERIDVFPTAKEEIIEDALRKIAVKQHLGFVDSMLEETVFGVKFSMSMLRKELSRHGHSMSYSDVVQSLFVMSGCQVEISCNGNRAFSRAPILAGIEAVSRENYLSDPSSLWSAHFHPMVASSLSSVAYRQFDYDTSMRYRSGVARWLHKRFVATYVNASIMQPLKLTLSHVKDQSGLLNYARTRDQNAAMLDAINEMKTSDHPVVLNIVTNAVLEGRKMVDVEYLIYPAPHFVAQVKAANARQRDFADNIKTVTESRSPINKLR